MFEDQMQQVGETPEEATARLRRKALEEMMAKRPEWKEPGIGRRIAAAAVGALGGWYGREGLMGPGMAAADQIKYGTQERDFNRWSQDVNRERQLMDLAQEGAADRMRLEQRKTQAQMLKEQQEKFREVKKDEAKARYQAQLKSKAPEALFFDSEEEMDPDTQAQIEQGLMQKTKSPYGWTVNLTNEGRRLAEQVDVRDLKKMIRTMAPQYAHVVDQYPGDKVDKNAAMFLKQLWQGVLNLGQGDAKQSAEMRLMMERENRRDARAEQKDKDRDEKGKNEKEASYWMTGMRQVEQLKQEKADDLRRLEEQMRAIQAKGQGASSEDREKLNLLVNDYKQVTERYNKRIDSANQNTRDMVNLLTGKNLPAYQRPQGEVTRGMKEAMGGGKFEGEERVPGLTDEHRALLRKGQTLPLEGGKRLRLVGNRVEVFDAAK
jgi:hypothetical protein